MLCPPKEDDLLPKDGTLLCPDSDAVSTATKPWWVKVACLAKKWHVLVVVGVYDWGPCVPGPDPFIHRPFPCVGNLTVFNKAVVFGVDGTLLAVHHKHHMAHTLTPTENISVRRAVTKNSDHILYYLLSNSELHYPVIWMFPKIVGFPPKSSILIGIFHSFHHPFWGFSQSLETAHMGIIISHY